MSLLKKSGSKEILHHAAMSVILTFVNFEQPSKASFPILVTLLGIVMELRFKQSLYSQIGIYQQLTL